jgi:hypothetical protein
MEHIPEQATDDHSEDANRKMGAGGIAWLDAYISLT